MKARSEVLSLELLLSKGFASFLPVYVEHRRYSDRIRQNVEVALFPGYLFCRFDARKKVAIMETAGVIGIVAFGGRLAPVDDDEIAALRSVTQSGLRYDRKAGIPIGQKVLLEAGPLAGLTGILVESKKACRLAVAVTLLNRSVTVEIEPRWFSRVSGETPGARPDTRIEGRL